MELNGVMRLLNLDPLILMRFFPSVLVIISCSWFAGCSSPTTLATGDQPAPAGTAVKSASTSDSDMPFPKLEKGTTAEVVRQKLGAPAEIQPTPSPEGKAEIWIYKYEKDLGTVQIATGTREVQVMSPTSTASGTASVQEPVYTTAIKKQEITLSLLMFNGQLQVQKAKVEQTVDHN
jgi:hypothetical protein